ncbi:MAG: hypothetical protein IJJ26_01350, partial [Victivallales bacterium]|nr:hypothetical protein [Victivallales bacterium]
MDSPTVENPRELQNSHPNRFPGAMTSSLKPGVVTTPSLRSSPSLAAFWRLGGSFAISLPYHNVIPVHVKANDSFLFFTLFFPKVTVQKVRRVIQVFCFYPQNTQ